MLRSVSASVRRCSKSSFEIASNQEMKGNLKRLLSSPSLTAQPPLFRLSCPHCHYGELSVSEESGVPLQGDGVCWRLAVC